MPQQRQCERSFVLYKALTRACHNLTPYEELTLACKERLGIKDIDRDYEVKKVAIGLATTSLTPVFIGPPDVGAALDTVSTYKPRTEPADQLCGSNVILHEYCTVPGNVKKLGQLLLGYRVEFKDEEDPVPRVRESNEKALKGLCAPPPRHRDPANQRGMPLPQMHLKDNGHKNGFWSLQWPPLSMMKIPAGMIQALETFLRCHPQDPMSIDLATAATIIYFDMKRRDWDPKAWKLQSMVPDTMPLGLFIIYFPHFLRFIETLGLTQYPHPLQFIQIHYDSDRRTSFDFTVSHSEIDTVYMEKAYRAITTKSGALWESRRYTLLPHSMPGTGLIWPQGTGKLEPPSQDLNVLLLLDDIRTVGLPSYFQRREKVQNIGFLKCVAKSWVRGNDRFIPAWPTPPDSFWFPEKKPRFVSLTGPAEFIGPLFQALTPSHENANFAAQDMPMVTELDHNLLAPIGRILDPEMRQRLAEANNERIQIFMTKLNIQNPGLNIQNPGLYCCKEDLTLKWRGMESDLIAARQNGILGDDVDYTKIDHLSDEFLSTVERERMRDLLNIEPLMQQWVLVKGLLQSEGPLPVVTITENIISAYRNTNNMFDILKWAWSHKGTSAGKPEVLAGLLKGLAVLLLRSSGLFSEDTIASMGEYATKIQSDQLKAFRDVVGADVANLFKAARALGELATPETSESLWLILTKDRVVVWYQPYLKTQLSQTRKVLEALLDLEDRLGQHWEDVIYVRRGGQTLYQERIDAIVGNETTG
ncbi:hypothetical protein BGZ63DRAFT_418428 [Mariannaea sp. PMI_226]|nr:hypothetical protein BGZ63DRAFT_418428 [Mariannaea sp. PMI_226]